MNRNLIAAAISGALVLPVAALAQDDGAKEMHEHSSTVYGTFRYGVTVTDNDAPGSNSAFDIGSNHAADSVSRARLRPAQG